MKLLQSILLAAILPVAFISCSKDRVRGSGDTITVDRNVSDFQKISAGGATDIHITQGTTFSVQVRGYENLLSHYETKVVNGELRLGFKDGSNVSNDNTEVFITMPSLSSAQLAGSGDLETTGFFQGSSLRAVTTGSGSMRFTDGEYDNFDAEIEGSGKIRAFGISALEATAEITGSGDVEITVEDHLDVTIRGSGNVTYRGTPTTTADITGSGRLIKD